MSLALRLARRLGWALVVVGLVAALGFVLTQLVPGDPARVLAGPHATKAELERVRALYELDASPARQLVRTYGRLVHGGPSSESEAAPETHSSCLSLGRAHVDLGRSVHYRKPVTRLLSDKARRSLDLALGALVVQCLVGLGLGLAAAARRDGPLDRAALGLSLALLCVPSFVVGLGLQRLLGHDLRWFPVDGDASGGPGYLRSLALPSLTLGLVGAGLFLRITRDEVSRALASPFATTARAKGASRARILVRHAVPIAIVPMATLLLLDLGTLAGGAIVTERIFRWPGLGSMMVEAVANRDGPLLVGLTIAAALLVALATLLVDALTWMLDPRLR
jgi:peptide/nickel transport system permease protein